MEYILEGNISVKAALLGNHRPIHTIIVDKRKKDRDTHFILTKAKQRKIEIQYKEREEIDALAQGNTHGGLLAICGQREFQTLQAYETKEEVFLALVEGIEDPFNFGSILRTLYAAGCDGIIVPARNWTSAAGIIAKASAGASEYIPMIVAQSMEDITKQLKEMHIPLVCAMRCENALSLYEYTFTKRCCIAIGGEMRGLSKTVRLASSQNVYIPYANDFRNAMSAASSTAIFAFERMRQLQK